jgi:hypothetical protein
VSPVFGGCQGAGRSRPAHGGVGVAAQAGPPNRASVASGPYADHHLLCVNGAMTGTEGLRRGATEFPPMRHSSAPYFSVSARNQTAATNRQFLSFQQKSAARTGGPVARQGPLVSADPTASLPHDSRTPAGESGICGVSCAGQSRPPQGRSALACFNHQWPNLNCGVRYRADICARGFYISLIISFFA